MEMKEIGFHIKDFIIRTVGICLYFKHVTKNISRHLYSLLFLIKNNHVCACYSKIRERFAVEKQVALSRNSVVLR